MEEVSEMTRVAGWRIQPADRDPQQLLDPDHQWSEMWGSGDVRHGISVIPRRDDLVEYMITRGGYVDETMVLVQVEGERSDELDHDHDFGVELILPDEIISVEPVPEWMITEISEGQDKYWGV